MASWFPGEVKWHVREEYIALMLTDEDWIGEWEFVTAHPSRRPSPRPGSIGEWVQKRGAPPGRLSEYDPDVWIGDWRSEPINFDEAKKWVDDHWPRREDSERMAKRRREHLNQRWRERLKRVASRYGARPPSAGGIPETSICRRMSTGP